MIQIRMATLDDIAVIVEIYRADRLAETWYRYTGEKSVETPLVELDLFQQFLNGGPWMNEILCGIHVNNLLKAGQTPLVAELDGQVVGNIELFSGIEEQKKKMHIGVLQTHLNWRQRGIGHALLNKTKELALAEGCSLITVWAAGDAIPFYIKNGFTPYFDFLRIGLEAQWLRAYKVEEVPTGIFAAGFPKLVLGVHQSSTHQWVIFREKEFILTSAPDFHQKELLISQESRLIAVFLPQVKMSGAVEVIAWKDRELDSYDIELVLTRAKDLGFSRVMMRLAANELVKINFSYQILGQHQVLAYHL